jgi:manganese oxidase
MKRRGAIERCLVLALFMSLASARAATPRIVANDNRVAAGTLRSGVLTLHIELRRGRWLPQADSGPSEVVQGFAEEGHSLSIPGPLVRVPAGTLIRIRIRNTLADSTLVMYGLQTQPATSTDTVQIRAGTAREVRFRAGSPGTYFYWGTTTGSDMEKRDGVDSQLYGVIVVDPAGTTGPSRDRIFAIGAWHQDPDTTKPKPWIPRDMMVINGKSWPSTERFEFNVGDTVRWRWVNPTVDAHPMHMHGFYFDVDSRGAWAADTVYSPADRRRVVTELMLPGGTMTMHWVPRQPGNWLFHCHFGFHVSHYISLNAIPDPKDPDSPMEVNHTADGMAGLVLGIHVRGPATQLASRTGVKDSTSRRIRLFINGARARFGKGDAYAFVVQNGQTPPAADSVPARSSTLLLRRGEPVRITMVNNLPYPAAIHWHGIELQDSYMDGVPGWSGSPGRTAPMVMPGDSFTAAFTPPRAGTFIYHSHSNDSYQIASGLAAPLIVLEPGATYDTATDRTFLINQEPNNPHGRINGQLLPDTLHLIAGTAYRFRLIAIAPDWRVWVTLSDSSGPLRWHAIAKDGADLPAHQATARTARLLMGAGETADFGFTPNGPGPLTLEVATQKKGWTVKIPVVVDNHPSGKI